MSAYACWDCANEARARAERAEARVAELEGAMTEEPSCDVCGEQQTEETATSMVCRNCYDIASCPHPAVAEVVPADTLRALRAVAGAARAVDTWLTRWAREADCEAANGEHQALRDALDALGAQNAGKALDVLDRVLSEALSHAPEQPAARLPELPSFGACPENEDAPRPETPTGDAISGLGLSPDAERALRDVDAACRAVYIDEIAKLRAVAEVATEVLAHYWERGAIPDRCAEALRDALYALPDEEEGEMEG